eukprot:CAMPEP_0178415502 /NCGR_PEP_ID=MMETSP0689_2-20121128/23583_1 /TAXON_ID=160604 /ORGANISM="Amphidinium massartii, Strain CS-259" /LENGTH=181 /DNA_ID=CAMNT_0020036821 /DNA_START=62 /DNA_END=603 /DNA_ORIENTATION=-
MVCIAPHRRFKRSRWPVAANLLCSVVAAWLMSSRRPIQAGIAWVWAPHRDIRPVARPVSASALVPTVHRRHRRRVIGVAAVESAAPEEPSGPSALDGMDMSMGDAEEMILDEDGGFIDSLVDVFGFDLADGAIALAAAIVVGAVIAFATSQPPNDAAEGSSTEKAPPSASDGGAASGKESA